MTGGARPPGRLAPAPGEGGGSRPRHSSRRRGERTSAPPAGTRGRAGGRDARRRGRGPGAARGSRAAGGSLAPRSGAHKRQRRPRPPGEAQSPDGVKDRGPLGAGFGLVGIRLPGKGRGQQAEARRGGQRLGAGLAWGWWSPRRCPGAASFDRSAVPSRPQPARRSPPARVRGQLPGPVRAAGGGVASRWRPGSSLGGRGHPPSLGGIGHGHPPPGE